MRFRAGVLIILAGLVAAYPLFAPVAAPSRTYLCDRELFPPVFASMNRTPGNMGCVGCHIRDTPEGRGQWFGMPDDEESVYQTLVTGITPAGDVLDPPPAAGGRDSILGV